MRTIGMILVILTIAAVYMVFTSALREVDPRSLPEFKGLVLGYRQGHGSFSRPTSGLINATFAQQDAVTSGNLSNKGALGAAWIEENLGAYRCVYEQIGLGHKTLPLPAAQEWNVLSIAPDAPIVLIIGRTGKLPSDGQSNTIIVWKIGKKPISTTINYLPNDPIAIWVTRLNQIWVSGRLGGAHLLSIDFTGNRLNLKRLVVPDHATVVGANEAGRVLCLASEAAWRSQPAAEIILYWYDPISKRITNRIRLALRPNWKSILANCNSRTLVCLDTFGPSDLIPEPGGGVRLLIVFDTASQTFLKSEALPQKTWLIDTDIQQEPNGS